MYTLDLQLPNFTPLPFDLQFFGLQLPVVGEGLLRNGEKIPHPLPQRVFMNVQIARHLPDRQSALPHQLDCSELELSQPILLRPLLKD
jgi:hypothetical protein